MLYLNNIVPATIFVIITCDPKERLKTQRGQGCVLGGDDWGNCPGPRVGVVWGAGDGVGGRGCALWSHAHANANENYRNVRYQQLGWHEILSKAMLFYNTAPVFCNLGDKFRWVGGWDVVGGGASVLMIRFAEWRPSINFTKTFSLCHRKLSSLRGLNGGFFSRFKI